jgi:lysozyme
MGLIEQLKRDEGVRYRPYRDTKGLLTVGVGRNIDAVPFSDDEVDLMLANDIKVRQKELAEYAWYADMDAVRQGAILNMSFAGVGTLLHFPHMIAALAKKDWVTAAAELANSQYATEVGDRAKRLEQQILTGEWQ